MGRVKRIRYLSPMRAAKVQASLRIRAVSPEPPLLAYISSESRGTFRQKARSLAPLNGWACAVKICHDGMLEDTNSLDGAHMKFNTMYRTSASELNAKLCSFDTIRAVFSRTTALIVKHAFITPQTVFEDWRWGGGAVYTVVRSSFRPSVTLRFSLISWKGSDGNLEIHQTL